MMLRRLLITVGLLLTYAAGAWGQAGQFNGAPSQATTLSPSATVPLNQSVSPISQPAPFVMTGLTYSLQWGSTNTNTFSFDSTGNPKFGLFDYVTPATLTNSPKLCFGSAYQNSGTPTFGEDDICFQSIPSSGLNGNITLTGTHTGSTGAAVFSFPGTFTASSTASFSISTRSRINSGADGVLNLENNAASDFTRLNFGGVTSSFPAIGKSGTVLTVQLADGSAGGTLSAGLYATVTNCAAVGSAASPSVAACTAAIAGSVSCATNAVNTCTVNTTAVTANSEIFVEQRLDATTGTRLGVTCNGTTSVVKPDINAVVAATSFSFALTQPVTNPNCYSYHIIN